MPSLTQIVDLDDEASQYEENDPLVKGNFFFVQGSQLSPLPPKREAAARGHPRPHAHSAAAAQGSTSHHPGGLAPPCSHHFRTWPPPRLAPCARRARRCALRTHPSVKKMSILLVIFFELGLERAAELGLERAAAELWFDDDVLLFVLTMV